MNEPKPTLELHAVIGDRYAWLDSVNDGGQVLIHEKVAITHFIERLEQIYGKYRTTIDLFIEPGAGVNPEFFLGCIWAATQRCHCLRKKGYSLAGPVQTGDEYRSRVGTLLAHLEGDRLMFDIPYGRWLPGERYQFGKWAGALQFPDAAERQAQNNNDL